jgi:uncharacterized membrane protein (DUF373 family)
MFANETFKRLIENVVVDVLFSLVLAFLGKVIADLPLRDQIWLYAVAVFPLIAFVRQVVALLFREPSLPWSVLALAALCFVLVTLSPLRQRVVDNAILIVRQLMPENGSGPSVPPIVTDTPSPMPRGSVTPGRTATAAPSSTPMSTATCTPRPVEQPAPACAVEPLGEFRQVWDRARLGCPAAVETASWAAWQKFEGGALLWWETTRRIYVLYQDGRWTVFDDLWTTGNPESDPSIAPPAGRFQPVRGFGKVWRERQGVREKLGWAIEREQGLCITAQMFEKAGLMMRYDLSEQGCAAVQGYSPPGIKLGLILYGDRSWTRYR